VRGDQINALSYYTSSISGALASCHYAVEHGGMTIGTYGRHDFGPGESNGFHGKSFVQGQADVRDNMSAIWYDDYLRHTPLPDYPDQTHVPIPTDVRLASRPFGTGKSGRLHCMPHGRIGHPLTERDFVDFDNPLNQWNDSFEEAKRCIDDAIESEALGWEHNKTRPFIGFHHPRTIYLNIHESAVVCHIMRENGYDVKATLRTDDNSYTQSFWGDAEDPNPFTTSPDATEVLDYYGVVYNDFTWSDFNNGNAGPFQVFFSFGCGIANQVTDGDIETDWANSLIFQKGSFHMTSTSFPSNSLITALTRGACAGIAGSIEPFNGNTPFEGNVVMGMLGGKTVMEAHWDSMYRVFTANQFAAGDPLYAPFERAQVAHCGFISEGDWDENFS
jgi:hypothetical protein